MKSESGPFNKLVDLKGLVCPRCRSPINQVKSDEIHCSNDTCEFSEESAFPVIFGLPVLIDFDNSVVGREPMLQHSGKSQLERKPSGIGKIISMLLSSGRHEIHSTRKYVNCLGKTGLDRVRILIIGGGGRRTGTNQLFESSWIQVVSSDIYISEHVDVIADGHQLPWPADSFDGIYMQAVLEHVLDPAKVVSEAFRVLKENGVVYCGTPFLQPVHEGAYDFTRFTHSGHRWLFAKFTELESGLIGGPGTTLLWAIRYFFAALFRNQRAGIVAAVPFFWVRYFDLILSKKYSIPAANGVYFIGRKQKSQMKPNEIIDYYQGSF